MYGVGFFMTIEESVREFLDPLVRSMFFDFFGSNINNKFDCYNAHNALEFYNAGRKMGNITRAMDRNGYLLNSTELLELQSDLFSFMEDYFSDANRTEKQFVEKLNNSFYEINLNDFFYHKLKKHITERQLEMTYADRWIMYNKLFGGSK